MNVIETTEGLLLQIFTDATIISGLMALSWLILVFTMLRRPIPRRRVAVFVALFIVIQWVFNLVLSFTPIDASGVFMLEAITFTIQLCLMVFIFCFRTKGRFAKTLASTALGYFIMHAFLLAILQTFTNWKLTYWIEYPDSLAIVTLTAIIFDAAAYLIMLSYALLLRYVMQKARFGVFFNSLFSSDFKSGITCFFCILLMHSARIVNFLFPEAVLQASYFYVVASIDVFFLLFLLFVSVFETNREKLRTQDAFIVQQQIYVGSLERMQQEVRSFRHDFQNIMSGLWLQASEGDLEGVQNRVKGTLRYFDENIGTEIKQASQLANINIIELKSLVMVKMVEMRRQKISGRIEVLNPVTICAMETEDLLRCLGILLDNAIEAARMCRDPWVSLVLYQEHGDLSIAVTNPVSEPPLLHELMKPGYSTKGKGRGVGLSNLRAIVAGYRSTAMKTICENGEFRQELKIRRKR